MSSSCDVFSHHLAMIWAKVQVLKASYLSKDLFAARHLIHWIGCNTGPCMLKPPKAINSATPKNRFAMDAPKSYLINDVSRQVGLSPKRIREYEHAGLIKPRREAHTNNRLYAEPDISHIGRIKQLIHEYGFTIAGLKYLLSAVPCWIVFQCVQKASCPAYQSPHLRCYLVKLAKDESVSNRCHQCAIFLNRHREPFALFEKR
jgi:DNA-binding transcriptional MerR regulator